MEQDRKDKDRARVELEAGAVEEQAGALVAAQAPDAWVGQ
jgi:hypothetical protein